MAQRSPFARVAFVGFLSAIVASEVVAFVTAGFNDQFAFLLWTVPFAFAVGGVTCSVNRFFAQRGALLRLIIAMFVGASIGISWAVVTSMTLGPWARAFSMPYGQCWIAGGASGGATVALFGDAQILRGVPGAIVSAICLAVVSFGLPPLVDIAAQNRTVTIVCVEYKPIDEPLTIDDSLLVPEDGGNFTLGHSLKPSDIAAVKKCFPNGALKVNGASTTGSGPQIRLVLVMHRAVGNTKEFKLPENGSVVFIQTASGWHEEPVEYRALDRSIVLRDYRYDSQGKQHLTTSYEIENADGSRTGGLAFQWRP